MPRYTRIVNRI